MPKFNTKGIVLDRINYGEADRILTFLTYEYGKVKVIAKGVRRTKSRLAGGIELFSVSDIGVIKGSSEISTLVSSRLIKHYGRIVNNLERTQLAYRLINDLNKSTEDQLEPAYFNLLNDAFKALNDDSISLDLIEAWLGAQLLKMGGRAPNLQTQKSGARLEAGKTYAFSFDTMCFEPGKSFNSAQIKFLRLLFGASQPKAINRVREAPELARQCLPLCKNLFQTLAG